MAATVAGAVTFGASAIIGKTVATVGGRVLANAAVSATISATQAETLNVVAGQHNDVGGAAVLGAAGGGAGSYVGDKVVAAFQAGKQAAFDALSTADKLKALSFLQANPNLTIGSASPTAVTLGNAVGTFIGSGFSELPPDSVSSLVPEADAATSLSLTPASPK